jgi:hypothetical protein
LAENVTKKLNVLQRLLITMGSGLLAWWLTDYSLARVVVWEIDYLRAISWMSVLFTGLAVSGVANSIIVGFNGLAFTTSTLYKN